jgi:CMP-N,N'-diacetyllegionaminic acid synthase
LNNIAIIPARSGSKSIKDKNIAMLSGHPVLAYSIAAAKCSSLIDRVIISTDSIKYAEIAKKYGAEVPFLRPTEYSTDLSNDRDFLIHAMSWIEEHEKQTPEFWVHLRPTTPLRHPDIIDNAIKVMIATDFATSLRSGYRASESPLKWFKKNENGYFQGILGLSNDESNLPRESFETIYIPDGYVDIVRRSFVLRGKKIHGDRMIGFESPVTTEVDSTEEFEYLQYQLEKKGSFLKEYLDKN